MKVVDVRCAHCKARLDVAAGARYEICAFCGAQLELGPQQRESQSQPPSQSPVDVTVLRAPTASPSQVPESELAAISDEIASLDTDWETRRKQLLVQRKDGSVHVPDVGLTVAIGMALILAGLVWTLVVGTYVENHEYPRAYTVSGVIFVYFAVQILARGIRRAQRYEDAFHQYRDRRMDLQRSRGGA